MIKSRSAILMTSCCIWSLSKKPTQRAGKNALLPFVRSFFKSEAEPAIIGLKSRSWQDPEVQVQLGGLLTVLLYKLVVDSANYLAGQPE